MTIKNPTTLLTQAVKYPAAIEEKLPAGAPKISTMLTDTAAKLPVLPDLPVELPDLPAAPTLPEMPTSTAGALNLPFVSAAKVTKVTNGGKTVTPLEQAYTQPTAGVLQEVTTRRGM